MVFTSAGAAKYLKSLNNEYKALLYKEQQSRMFVASIQEDKEKCRPDYDYGKVQKELAELAAKIRKVKHAINVFNTTTKVPGFDMTIDQMLVYIPQLTARQAKLAKMRSVLPQTRVDHYQSNIIDYQYVNYDLKRADEDYKKVSNELSRAQLALDEVNTTVQFEI